MAFLILLSLFSVWSTPAYAGTVDGLDLSSDSYLLMEAGSGQVLLGHNVFSLRHPASTTKIVTAILICDYEECLPEIALVNRAAAFCAGSSMGLNPNERITVQSLLFGAMLPSGNDAATALAYHMAGGEEWFAWMMNRKARLLGAADAYFCNPHGLTCSRHLASAYDLATITRYALQNPHFRNAVTRKSKVVASVDGSRIHYLVNTNRLLWEWPDISGVKTGTTAAAGKCLVASAARYPRELIAVVLRSADRFNDARELLQLGFVQFDSISIGTDTLIQDSIGVTQDRALAALRPFYWAFPISEAKAIERRFHYRQRRLEIFFRGRMLDTIPLAPNRLRVK